MTSLRPEQPSSKKRTWGQRLVLLFNLALIALSLSAAALLDFANDRAASINRVALDRSLTALEEADSGERVINVLLVGSDSSANLDPDDPIQIGRQGERLGDVIIVAHLDERSGSVALLSLPRDLWLPIAGTERSDRINRAFLVGGAAALIDTIEEAFEIPIHHYVNVDFAGFQGLVEAVGSVDVHFDSPARDWNIGAKPVPRSQTGFLVETPGCHSLDPTQALAYVRSRYYQTQNVDGEWVTDPTSDLGRIRRQQDFLQRLMQKAIDLGARNPLVLGNLIDTGIENVAIDQELTPSLILDLSGTYRGFEPGDLQTYTFPVTDGTVGSNRVLIPQVAEAAPILELFSGERFDAASTVAVEIVYDESLASNQVGPVRLPASVAAVAEKLEAAGFDVSNPEIAEVEPGLYLRHSGDGHAAAEIVVAALGSTLEQAAADGVVERGALTLQETAGMSGRNVVVAIGTSVETADSVSDLVAGSWVTSPFGAANDDLAAPFDPNPGEENNPLGPTIMPSDLGEPEFVAEMAIPETASMCG